VPRVSARNFLRVFAELEIDDAEKGVEVSDNVQLVYIADDLRQRNNVHVGVGTLEAAVVGEHAILSLQVRNKNGVTIDQISFTVTPFAGVDDTVRIWASQTLPTIVGPAVLVAPLRSGFLGPESFVTAGTILAAAIPTSAFRQKTSSAFTPGFYVSGPRATVTGIVDQFVNVVFNLANTPVGMGIRWTELRLFP